MRRRQGGVAVVTALLLTTLAVTIVASLFWQQQVQVRSMENQRLQLQTRWIVRGALDLSRLVLFQDYIDTQNQAYTQLGGIWAMPLEETRLDDYIERERAEAENFNATLSGRMIDAQSRYNLANLADKGQPTPREVMLFERLLTNLRLDSSLAQAVARQVADAQPQQLGQQSVPAKVIGLMRVEDLLAVSGFTPQTIEKLRDFVIVLPKRTKLNANTVSAELMSAMMDKMSMSDAAAIVNTRKRAYYRDKPTFDTSLPAGVTALTDYDVNSNFFLAYSRVRLDRAALDTQSLLERAGNGITSVVWIREN
ncbi:type II secretion system minor pseudopilin GspK [Rugamonas aquatica]|uniref:Type II secretion system protein K n=1 Tax=Rugamonas aquatica TaxID=2743357 RepID=A0A6A7N0V1_9BURK|nr:type II secretion system minor pseudopilin GspK [Rugamonas aquatica]MQA38663.1 general secretion pathway protein GspK [Rugamonas aquatica]